MEYKILIKKINNELSESEAIEFDTWYSESKAHRDYFERVKNKNLYKQFSVNSEESWNELQIKLGKKKSSRKKYLKTIGFAASILVIFSLGTFGFFFSRSNPVNQNIESGTDKAILTLSSGENVQLQKGSNIKNNIFQSNGINLVYNKQEATPKRIEYNLLTVPRGGQFQLQLDDSTLVWLNSASKIKYPIHFKNGEPRRVELVYGEAYFEVSPSIKNGGSIFTVITDDQSIEVLGTKFNIQAYPNESITSTLVEGKIKVSAASQEYILLPNQEAEYSIQNQTIEISDVDIHDAIAWKEGFFGFENTSLEDIMKVLSRWYNTDVKFENRSARVLQFNGVLSKKQNIKNVLDIISTTNDINYEIKNRTIIIK